MKIKMLSDANISFGPQRLFLGQEIDLPDDVAGGLVDQGLAVSLEKEVKPKPKPAKVTVTVTAKKSPVKKSAGGKKEKK